MDDWGKIEKLQEVTNHLKLLEAMDNLRAEEEALLEFDLDTARKRRRSCWARDWILRRPLQQPLYEEFREEDVSKFGQAFRMPPPTFSKLLEYIKADMERKDTVMRAAISPETRLQVFLRFITSGANYKTLEDIFRIPVSVQLVYFRPILKFDTFILRSVQYHGS